MKTVMISIRPEWCDKIISGKKTVEIRKTRPKIAPPFKVFIYCTMGNKSSNNLWITDPTGYNHLGNGKVIGEFVCDHFDEFTPTRAGVKFKRGLALYESALSLGEIREYLCGKKGYGWHISDLVVYDKPLLLNSFRKQCVMPEWPYCPACDVGYEYISETEAEFLRVDGTCNTEWRCLNYLKRPPQSWCYVEVCDEKS